MAAQSPLVDPEIDNIYLYPEKPLASDVTQPTGLPDFDQFGQDWGNAVETLTQFAEQHKGMITIVSADEPIAADYFGAFREKGLQIAAPSALAAEIESSKDFMKELSVRLGVPTATHETFEEFDEIIRYASELNKFPIVIKADGLAAGKGVKICTDLEDLKAKLHEFEYKGWLGEGKKVIVEEYLEGPEISLHAWCDGETYVMFPFAMQDHKTIYANDEGPMTGGMGVITPVPGLTIEDIELLGKEFIKPYIDALKVMGREFKGVMYPSIKLTSTGPKLLEVNARLGDPEAPACLPMLKSDFLEITIACANGRLAETPKPIWRKGAAVCIALAAKGYPDPDKTETGALITGIEKAKKKRKVQVFDYGTRNDEEGLKVDGGRVLGVAAYGRTLRRALKRGYRAAQEIQFDGEKPQIRLDIGKVACSDLFKDRVKIMREALTDA